MSEFGRVTQIVIISPYYSSDSSVRLGNLLMIHESGISVGFGTKKDRAW